MNSRICSLPGIEFPLVAFSHCRDVVVEVSRAGGLGVLGATGFTPEQLQALVSEPALRQIDKLAEAGHESARQLATYWVGQGVGLMDESGPVRSVVHHFKRDFLAACERLQSVPGEGAAQ